MVCCNIRVVGFTGFCLSLWLVILITGVESLFFERGLVLVYVRVSSDVGV